MNNEPYMDAIVEMALFLEFSEPDIVDEEAAIGMMEQIAASLQKLGKVEKEQFLMYLQRRAAQGKTSEQQQSIENLAAHFGLLPE
jgi:hypothetical protein